MAQLQRSRVLRNTNRDLPSAACLLGSWLVMLGLGGWLTAADQAPGFLTSRRPAADAKQVPPHEWSTEKNIAWKVDVAGRGWSSPIVWNEQVILTTCVNSGVDREAKKGLYMDDVDANAYPKPTTVHEWKVLSLDINSGKTLWERVVNSAIPTKPHHVKNSLASETPVTDGERIYVLFGNLGLYCLDMQGNVQWSHLLPPVETRSGWGTSASPVVHGDRLYLVNDNDEQSYMLAFDKRSGQVLWRVERQEQTNYSTPFVWQHAARTEIVTSGTEWVRSYSLDGQLLWQLKGISVQVVPTPFECEGNLVFAAGHAFKGDNPLMVIRPGASGDITPEKGQTTNEFVLWSNTKTGPYQPTPLVVDGVMYVLYDRGFLATFDVNTGKEVYPRQRIPDGRAFTSSPWTYDGKLFCLNEDGVTFVIDLGDKFKISHTNRLAEDDMGMATPVIVGDKLLIRTAARIYCVAASAEPR